MKKFYVTLLLVAFASLIFVNCNKDDEDEIIEEILPPDPFDLEREFGGADAVNILTESTYTSLTIELAYVAGSRPQQSSLDSLKSFINKRANKSGGITFVETVIPAQSAGPYSFDRLQEVEEEYRTQFRGGTNLALWIYMVSGEVLGENGQVDMGTLAAVYYNTSMYVVIPALVRAAVNAPISGYDGVEATTLQHEFCHYIGLVNTLETGDTVHPIVNNMTIHESLDNKGHCQVESCLMYFADNNPFHAGYVSRLQGGFLVNLDPLCIADLQAIGGK